MRRDRVRALALAAAVLCAGLAPADAAAQPDSVVTRTRGPRIPGTTMRLGDSLSMVRGRSDLRGTSDPDLAPGELAYTGTMRFYGGPAETKLVFHEGRLLRASFVLKPASTRTRAYVEDDLRRQGYRADCRRARPNDRDCDWAGPLSVTVRADTAQISAEFGAPGFARSLVAESDPGQRGPSRSYEAVLASDSTQVLPDTLDLREPNANGYPPPVITKSVFARIPDEIRGEVERGSIIVLAFVGAEGQVQYVRALDGPEELRPVAEGAVMQYRFQRYAIKEGRRRFWVRVSVYPA